MSLRDRLKSLNLDKVEKAASKPVDMSEKSTNLLLSRASSNVEPPQHDRPLKPLMALAKTMKSDDAPTEAREVEKVAPTAPLKPNLVAANKKLSLAERLAQAKQKPAEEATQAPTEAPKNEPSKKLSLAERIALAKGEQPKPKPQPEPKAEPSAIEKAMAFAADPAPKTIPRDKRMADYLEKQGASPKTAMTLAQKLAARKLDATVPKAEPKPLPKIVRDEGYEAIQPREDMPPPAAPKPKMSLAEKIAARKAAEARPVDAVPPSAAVLKQIAAEEEVKTSSIKLPKITLEVDNQKPQATQVPQAAPEPEPVDDSIAANRKMVVLNEKQQLAVDSLVHGESMCVVGPAGSGKTTTVRSMVHKLRELGLIDKTSEFKRYGGNGAEDRVTGQWSVAFVAFTRTATNNLRASIAADESLLEFWDCAQTVHNLLEYTPEYYMKEDPETGIERETMRFIPMRDEDNQLDIDYIFIEESSMVDLDLADKLMRALPTKCKVVYLGDINQLPPVFGLPILAYALNKLRTVELTEVYRTGMGPVLTNAHRILNGVMPEEDSHEERGAFSLYHEFTAANGNVSIKNHSKDKGTPVHTGQENCARIYTKVFNLFHERGDYDPEQDMILSPWNKQDLGTVEMNYNIAQFLGDKRNATVFEIKAGFNKYYLAEGDKVFVNRELGTITGINMNGDYVGAAPQPASTALSRNGTMILGKAGADIDLDEEDDYANFDIEKLADQNLDEAKRRAASHIVTVELDGGGEAVLSSAGDYNIDKFSLGYVLTIHKSQGLEWRKVWVIAHKTQGATLTREALYTAATRAKKECAVFGHEGTIRAALGRQRLEGSTLTDKIAAFSGNVDNLEQVQVEPWC